MSRQLIRNATIVNGDGITPPYLGDILIDGERIVHLGAIPHSETKTAEHVVDEPLHLIHSILGHGNTSRTPVRTQPCRYSHSNTAQ